jgi:lipopolysaccharide transport system permease protein
MSSRPDAAPAPWVIEPVRDGVAAVVRELWQYRRLLGFFGSQSIKGLYQGTTLGIFWLFARPLLPIFISTFVFGTLLKIPSDGVPYFLFFLTGMSIWTLFDRSMIWVTRSLDQQRGIIKKLYFPRLLVPLSSVAPSFVYFGIYLALILGAAVYYLATQKTWYLAVGPGWFAGIGVALLAVAFAISVGLVTCVWQARHRDVRFGLRYAMGFWFYLTPVIYPMSEVPPHLHWVIYLNPMASVVETFKWGLLGVGQFPAMPLLSAGVITLLSCALGVWYFNRSQAASVDEM